jgi:hypothetical protein
MGNREWGGEMFGVRWVAGSFLPHPGLLPLGEGGRPAAPGGRCAGDLESPSVGSGSSSAFCRAMPSGGDCKSPARA